MRDRPPHVLVAYGSKRGGTREIAEVIAEELLNAGIDTELADAAVISNLTAYDAVVVGGALYMNRWHGDARRLLTHHVAELRARPVWMFSSGPLDDSANQHALPAPHQVDQLAHRIGAREHVVFGGRLTPDADGFIASAMAKQHAGDWREWHKIRSWAKDVATKILDEDSQPVEIPAPPPRGERWLLAAMCWFVALTAIGGGATLALRPDGSLMEASPSLLRFTPFATFLVPGLLLLFVVGFGNAIAGFAVARNMRRAALFVYFAGAALLVWIITEMVMLRTVHWLQLGYMLVAILILAEAWSVFVRPRHVREGTPRTPHFGLR